MHYRNAYTLVLAQPKAIKRQQLARQPHLFSTAHEGREGEVVAIGDGDTLWQTLHMPRLAPTSQAHWVNDQCCKLISSMGGIEFHCYDQCCKLLSSIGCIVRGYDQCCRLISSIGGILFHDYDKCCKLLSSIEGIHFHGYGLQNDGYGLQYNDRFLQLDNDIRFAPYVIK